ncbi:unnamed protein product [Rhizoctonia solani]|uniref:Uncharacterized protein n=1 Tax=Rhizoctonia solani TaxID=456999 RepID=A0A8H3CXS9_9AGAM|nr:unnamed protein product [Rhizoctonia solani]
MVETVKDSSLTGKIESLLAESFFRTLDTVPLKKPVGKLESSEITPSLEPVMTKPTSLEAKKAGRKGLISNTATSTKYERKEEFHGLEGFPYRFRCLPSGLGESPFNGFSIAEKRAKVKEAIDGSTNPSHMQTPKKSGHLEHFACSFCSRRNMYYRLIY